jgi:hypothetical protein
LFSCSHACFHVNSNLTLRTNKGVGYIQPCSLWDTQQEDILEKQKQKQLQAR